MLNHLLDLRGKQIDLLLGQSLKSEGRQGLRVYRDLQGWNSGTGECAESSSVSLATRDAFCLPRLLCSGFSTGPLVSVLDVLLCQKAMEWQLSWDHQNMIWMACSSYSCWEKEMKIVCVVIIGHSFGKMVLWILRA